jgi:hypothetical protein
MTLRNFLEDEAAKVRCWGDDSAYVRYAEDVNPDALTDAWLEKQTSYIWKVGVLVLADNNKLDWAYAFIGHEREPGKHEFIGFLQFQDGENDDPGRSIRRYVACLTRADHVFAGEED